ncbi:MAG: HemK2/MTQ2 family protein methyltransferase [Candidatus Bathyarchaeota archaeon]
MEPVYRPSEDSYLLLRHVERLVSGDVLDMGTGSGIQAVAAALKEEVSSVTAVDINPAALIEAEKRGKMAGTLGKMRFTLSDLFSGVEGVFDWIIFNPPYLPSEGEADEASWAGGGGGGDVIRRFLAEAHSHLKPGGVLMVYSSLTGIGEKDFEGYRVEVLEEQPLFYETLICVRLTPS